MKKTLFVVNLVVCNFDVFSPICCERQSGADYRLAGLGARINFGYTDCITSGDLATLCCIQHDLAATGVSVVTAHSRRLALMLVQSHKAFI